MSRSWQRASVAKSLRLLTDRPGFSRVDCYVTHVNCRHDA